VDGVIVIDLPPEEAGPLDAEAEPAGLDLVHLAAPTSTSERLRLIARRSRGFIYLVSLTGVTGERAALPDGLAAQIRALRLVTTKPVCVGFGIGRPEQVAVIGQLADGVAVGSAIVRLIEERAGAPSLVSEVGDFIASLKAPLLHVGGPDTAPRIAQAKGATPPSDSPSRRSQAPRGTRGALRSPLFRQPASRDGSGGHRTRGAGGGRLPANGGSGGALA
jgi:hypothetical protein